MLKTRIIILFFLVTFNFNLNAQISPDINEFVQQGNYSQALVIIDQKLINNSNNQELLHLKAQTELKLNQNNQAIKTYQLVIRLYPHSPDAYNNLAGIYAKQNKLELARETLEKGMDTNKSYALLHKNINSIYLEMARESYVKALQLGVKKHDVELTVASLDNNIKPAYKPITNVKREFERSPKSVNANTGKNTNPEIVTAISVKDEVVTALHGWAAAWSAQDVNLYLSYYNNKFLPENGSSRRNWITQRKKRLLKPIWIEVRLSNFLFAQDADNQVEVNVTQIYRSNNFRDKSKKKFLLTRSVDGWQILNEKNFKE